MSELKLYQCHKQVHAMPYTYGQYLNLTSRQREPRYSLGDAGYLVVYSKGSVDEYVSWSPAAAFENGYSLVTSPAELADPLEMVTRFGEVIVIDRQADDLFKYPPAGRKRIDDERYGRFICMFDPGRDMHNKNRSGGNNDEQV